MKNIALIGAGLLMLVVSSEAMAASMEQKIGSLDDLEKMSRLRIEFCDSKIRVANAQNAASKTHDSNDQAIDLEVVKSDCIKETLNASLADIDKVREFLTPSSSIALKRWYEKYQQILSRVNGSIPPVSIDFRELDAVMKDVKEALVL